jgi:hypothetical protein
MRQLDIDGAGKVYAEALVISRHIAAADPEPFAQRDLGGLLARLATWGQDGVTWADVAAQYEVVARLGPLTPAEQEMLDRARTFAVPPAK